MPPALPPALANEALSAFDTPGPNVSFHGWCLKAEPCPLHVVTHAPGGAAPLNASATLPLECTLPEVGGKGGLAIHHSLTGGFFEYVLEPARYAYVSEQLAAPSASSAVCAFAADWMRTAIERACTAADLGGESGAACPLQQHANRLLELAVTQLDGSRGEGGHKSVPCVLPSAS